MQAEEQAHAVNNAITSSVLGPPGALRWWRSVKTKAGFPLATPSFSKTPAAGDISGIRAHV